MPLEPEEQLHLEVAEGFFGLGMYLGADAAVDDIDRLSRPFPEALSPRA
jgi:hypothetical protein